MRRILAIAILAASVAAISVLGSGASDDTGSSYLVDAEFRNAFSVIPGEDVKIAGVKVGSIKDLDVTPQQTASVLLEITEPGFGDWRADAECSIRPQSLIGEKFVECTPTKPRPRGAATPPLLKTRDRDGVEVAVLPVDRTARAVDLDLVNNIARLPYRQRLTILINEFGAGVAGRGAELARIIRTADPALKQTDEVLDILARQNKVLARLAVDSDVALAPLARERESVAGFVTQASKVAEATANQADNLELSVQKLPAFLRELRLTMNSLGGLADQGEPLARDLNTVGPDISRAVEALGPFSEAATPALVSLGDTTVVGREALNKSSSLIGDLKSLASSSKPLAADLRQLTASFAETGGIERLMDFVFYGVASINGFDQYGHYLRAQLLVNLCSTYVVENDPACTANFVPQSSAASVPPVAVDDAERDPALVRTEAVLRGADPDATGARRADATAGDAKPAPADKQAASPLTLPKQVPPAGDDAPESPAPVAPAPAAPAQAEASPAQPAPASGTTGPDAGVASVLDYLLGSGS